MSPSLNQLTVGESLYALFKAGAWRDNSKTPMNFETLVYFNGNLVYNDMFSTVGNDLSDYSIDLTSEIMNLGPGENEVKLVTRPVGSCLNISAPVVQTQKLQLLAPEKYNLRFFVKDEDLNNVNGALINLKLISADDYYVQEPSYDENRITSDGIALFNELIAGDYIYKITSDNFNEVSGKVTVGSNTDIYITLYKNNLPPVIDLPDNFSVYYQNPIEFNLRDYVRDYNEDFNSLQIGYKLLNGNPSIVYNNGFFNIVSLTPQEAELEITVKDSKGESSKDVVKLYFIDNKAPVINSFTATPSSGDAPLNVMFNIDVTDSDSTNLNCRIDFGDNTYIEDSCSNLDGLFHTYNNPYTYVATLTVNDGLNKPITENLNIFVYEKGTNGPKIEYFYMSSSNGKIVPTNLTFNWSVSHPNNYSLKCIFRFNGVENVVPCNVNNYNISNFNITGISNFILIAEDNLSNIETRVISEEFASNVTAKLEDLEMYLLMADSIVPGDNFKFSLLTKNETLYSREVYLIPEIECDNTLNQLRDNNGILRTSGKSKNMYQEFKFTFETNTNDFKLNVPLNKSCIFRVKLFDNFGFTYSIEKYVTFNYPIEVRKVQSIRGKSVDIIDYLSKVSSKTFDKGYN
jgi:hypothetical protein